MLSHEWWAIDTRTKDELRKGMLTKRSSVVTWRVLTPNTKQARARRRLLRVQPLPAASQALTCAAARRGVDVCHQAQSVHGLGQQLYVWALTSPLSLVILYIILVID